MKVTEGLQSRKQQILEEAAKLFRNYGFKGTSLQQIAKKVGMEGPSLYNHISSKNEILSHLLMTNARIFHERITEIQTSSLGAIDKLDRVISLHIELTVANPDAMALMLHEWAHLEPAEKQEYVSLRDCYEREFQSILEQNIAEEKVVQMDVHFMMFMILSTLRSLYAWCAKYRDYNRLELEQNIKQGVLKGILAEG
ncbi:TetR/AcrR family transcriptional regulator [Roseivirga pacifica]|uniref:TetR/AcrR family transcriptional regulator n=1 Tax=Roseivirga pacifica TaxID=1267423 RepID=UPI003BAF153A